MKLVIDDNGHEASLSLSPHFIEAAWSENDDIIDEYVRQAGVIMTEPMKRRFAFVNAAARGLCEELTAATGCSEQSMHWADSSLGVWELSNIHGRASYEVERALAIHAYWRDAA